MPVKNMVKTIVYLEPYQYKWIKLLAEENGKSFSKKIRELLDKALGDAQQDMKIDFGYFDRYCSSEIKSFKDLLEWILSNYSYKEKLDEHEFLVQIECDYKTIQCYTDFESYVDFQAPTVGKACDGPWIHFWNNSSNDYRRTREYMEIAKGNKKLTEVIEK